ncbi:unnamed protein product [Ixodes pacificus]
MYLPVLRFPCLSLFRQIYNQPSQQTVKRRTCFSSFPPQHLRSSALHTHAIESKVRGHMLQSLPHGLNIEGFEYSLRFLVRIPLPFSKVGVQCSRWNGMPVSTRPRSVPLNPPCQPKSKSFSLKTFIYSAALISVHFRRNGLTWYSLIAKDFLFP